jgi:hypothetical protein
MVAISGRVESRLEGAPVSGSLITFSGPVTRSAPVQDGAFGISDLMTGFYTVTVEGPTHVTHKSVRVSVQAPGSFAFYVLPWGYSRFGAVYDDTFHRFFHQLARVRSSGTIAIGKWSSPPRELYVVEGSVPDEQFAPLLSVLSELNDETVPVLWCGTAGPLRLVTGPDLSFVPNGTIIVRPNWDGSGTGTTAAGNTQYGIITIPVWRRPDGRPNSPTELKGVLAHEMFHVAGQMDYWGNCILQGVEWAAGVAQNFGTPVTVSGSPPHLVWLNTERFPEVGFSEGFENRHHFFIESARGEVAAFREIASGPDLHRIATPDGAVLCSITAGPALDELGAATRGR